MKIKLGFNKFRINLFIMKQTYLQNFHHGQGVSNLCSNNQTIAKNTDQKKENNEKNVEAKQAITNIAKLMLDDLKEFSQISVDFFNKLQPLFSGECQSLMRTSCNFSILTLVDYQKKVESQRTSEDDRIKKMLLLRNLREKYFTEPNK